jgi:cation:H+ antiporter
VHNLRCVLPLAPGWNVLLAAVAAAVVWYAGAQLARYATAISDRLGGEQALIGVLLLGAIVSLPELATSVSAAAIGNAQLAVNTLLGGIAVTMLILAVIDGLVGAEPLTLDISHPVVLLQGVLVVVFLTIAAAGITVGEPSVLGVGAWSMGLLVLYFVAMLFVKRYERAEPWVPKSGPPAKTNRDTSPGEVEDAKRASQRPWPSLIARTALAAAAVLASGYVLALSGDALSEQTGLGGSFIGVLVGGVSTSLPELSTTLAAVRLRQFEMAFADAFGTNLFSISVLVFADIAYAGPPVLNEAGRFGLFAILLGLAMTAVYLVGLIARRNFTVLRMGIDSLAVIVTYAAGMAVLFQLR